MKHSLEAQRTKDRIAELIEVQRSLRSFADQVDPPRDLLLADDSSLSIRGNEAGLIRFALELLEISSGGELSSVDSEWLDSSWLPLETITLDPDPRFEATEKTLRDSILLFAVVGIFGVVLVTGLITCGDWLGRWFARLVHHLL